ncbi:DUF2878 domain-containing protein [Saccharospirillum sp.]|uniref:DUF2878 domain-containing protein n=1 Tax=Saccharospirillum sp. TaxID=2033801 RepID=UPI0034A04DD4
MKAKAAKVFFNYAGFQIGWFLLVLTQSAWAIFWALGFAVVHALLEGNRREWQATLPIMVFGLLTDLLWHLSQAVQFHGTGQPVPLWLVGLWLMFPLTLNHSLAWLKGRLSLQVILGVFGGGGSYVAGAQFGAATLTPFGLIAVPLAWGLWLPLFYWWIDRLNHSHPTQVTAS